MRQIAPAVYKLRKTIKNLLQPDAHYLWLLAAVPILWLWHMPVLLWQPRDGEATASVT